SSLIARLRAKSAAVTVLPLARQRFGIAHLQYCITRPSSAMTPMDDGTESLDTHWAVAVFETADRRELFALAENVRRQMLAGTWQVDTKVSEQLLPLSSAYELAARERLDLHGVGHPASRASTEQRL